MRYGAKAIAQQKTVVGKPIVVLVSVNIYTVIKSIKFRQGSLIDDRPSL